MEPGARSAAPAWSSRGMWPAGTRLLLAAATTLPDERDTGQMAAAAAEIEDWTGLLRIATEQKVVPLLYPNLKSACGHLIPELIMADMKQRYMASTQHNLMLTSELLSLLADAAAAQIPMLPFKGPVLAASAYGDLTRREFGDLDVLVRPADASRAAALLADRGYQESTRLNLSWERTFIHGERHIEVDLHWAFAPGESGLHSASFHYDLVGLWDRVRTCSVLQREVAALSAEDTLIALCQNSVKDFFRMAWPSLSWFCDLAQAIRSEPDMDWGLIDHLSSRYGCQRIVNACIDATADLFCETMDRPAVDIDPPTRRLAEDIGQRLLSNLSAPGRGNADLPLRDRLRFHWLARERWQDKAVHLLRPRLLIRAYRHERRTARRAPESAVPEHEPGHNEETLSR